MVVGAVKNIFPLEFWRVGEHSYLYVDSYIFISDVDIFY